MDIVKPLDKINIMIVIHILCRYDSHEKLLISSNCIESIVKKRAIDKFLSKMGYKGNSWEKG